MISIQRIRELCARVIQARDIEYEIALEDLHFALEGFDKQQMLERRKKPAASFRPEGSPDACVQIREKMKQRVLVVDDEASITATLSMILSTAPEFEVRIANSGPEALEIAEEFGPDTLITDYAMPDMNGFEVAAKLIQRLPACRIIFFSGYSQLPRPSVPSYRLLAKPVPPQQFLRLLRRETDAAAGTSRKPRVLYIDDIEYHRYSIARLLRLAGFDVVERSTGTQALSDAGRHPDLILLDVGLPDLDGFEVCRILKTHQDTASIPVIHLTASHLRESDRRESFASGAYDYIAEPFDPDHLLHRIRSALQVRYLDDSARA